MMTAIMMAKLLCVIVRSILLFKTGRRTEIPPPKSKSCNYYTTILKFVQQKHKNKRLPLLSLLSDFVILIRFPWIFRKNRLWIDGFAGGKLTILSVPSPSIMIYWFISTKNIITKIETCICCKIFVWWRHPIPQVSKKFSRKARLWWWVLRQKLA